MTTEHTSINEAGATPSSTPSSTSDFQIPDAYADRGWASKITSTDDLYKAYDNAQNLIGKRPAGIPTNDASDAEWDSFYKAAGRPDEAKYDFQDPEAMPEDFDTAEFKLVADQLFHKSGLSRKQANEIFTALVNAEIDSGNKVRTQNVEQQKALDAEFATLSQEHFGDNYDATQAATLEAINHYAPQSLKDSLGALTDNPKVLAAVMATIMGLKDEASKVRKEYGLEGSVTSGAQTTSNSIDDTRTALANLRNSPAFRDFSHPEHRRTMEQITDLSSAVGRHFK